MMTAHNDDTILRERYRLTNIVGTGGMGYVYRAEDLRLPGRLCAIKEIRLDPAATEEAGAQAHDQFLKEASVLARLDHPNLPKVSDYFSQDGREYLVMDYVPGEDLQTILRASREDGVPLDEATVLGWAAQIIDAMAYLHAQDPPVLHRDIKPSNIKLTPDNRIKLVDFGLVKLMAPDESRTITVLQGKGTALYTPLEQYGGADAHTDPRTDIYALGATLYHLLTDFPPADAKARFLNPSSLPAPVSINPSLSRHVSEALLWAMEMHPADRPANVQQLRLALAGTISRPRQMGDGRQGQEFGRAIRANWWVIGLVAGLFILAILLTFLVSD